MVGDTVALLKRTRLPRRHWKCTLAQIPDECSHKAEIVDWIGSLSSNVTNARGLLLMGDYSQGKSGCAAIILKAALARGIVGCWHRATDLQRVIIEQTPFDSTMTVLERLQTVPLLVIDEVQILKDNFAIQQIEQLVRRRIDDELCTVITTNHSIEELRAKYPALAAALVEAVRPIIVGGHDFRKARR